MRLCRLGSPFAQTLRHRLCHALKCTAAYPSYETVHIFVQIISRQETSEAHPTCLLSTARRRPLLADSLGKMTIAVMVPTSEPLSPGTFESRPPDEIRRDVGGVTIWMDCDAQSRRGYNRGSSEPSFPGRIVVRWMDGSSGRFGVMR